MIIELLRGPFSFITKRSEANHREKIREEAEGIVYRLSLLCAMSPEAVDKYLETLRKRGLNIEKAEGCFVMYPLHPDTIMSDNIQDIEEFRIFIKSSHARKKVRGWEDDMPCDFSDLQGYIERDLGWLKANPLAEK